MLGIRTMFLLPMRIRELVVSCFLSSAAPRAKMRLNFSKSVVGTATTTLGSGFSAFFLPNAKTCLLFNVQNFQMPAFDTSFYLYFRCSVVLQQLLLYVFA